MRRILIGVTAAAIALGAASSAEAKGRCGSHLWCDTSLSPQRRADLLVGAMTPQERISLLGGDTTTIAGAAGTHTGTSLGIPRLGLPDFFQTDGPVGVRQGQATAMPSSMSLASGFDRDLAARYAAVVADEAKAKGNDLVYAPTVNILRTPLWGRAFESYGEDPYLTARMAVSYIRSMQSRGVIANVKHFAVNNQEGASVGGKIEGSRYSVDARVDARTLREIYLPQFEAAVKEGRAGSVMCSYNRLNGPHACESKTLLTQILRREWGFKGLVLADYGASKRVGSGLAAGLDYEPFTLADLDGGENYTPAKVNAALAAGQTTQRLVDAAVRRTLKTLFAFGFFDRAAYRDDDSGVPKAVHRRVAQRVAERGAVLLRNDGTLPLRRSRVKSIAVIGADADRYVNGGGSSNIAPYESTTVRAGITARAGPGVRVTYDPGTDAAKAAAVARGADVAVVSVADKSSEGVDKQCLSLDCEPVAGRVSRDALVNAVAAANRHTVVVLQTSGPVLTPWRNRVAGILEAWYPGEAAGAAVARVLFGDVDPGGRLPATFPRRESDLATAGDPDRYPGRNGIVRYSEGVLVGYRWFDDKRIRPAYPFGFGLSYTRFAVRRLRVEPARRGAMARVSVDVANTGRRGGVAVPQLYLGLPGARGRIQPPRQLKGFASVQVPAGSTRRVSFGLDERAFSYWNAARGRWATAPGCYRIELGQSSRDIERRARLSVNGGRCRR